MTRLTAKSFAILALVTFGAGASADALQEELLVCRDLPDDVARLICYDTAVDRSRQRGSSRPTSAPAPQPAPTVPDRIEPAAAVAATGTVAGTISSEDLFGQSGDEMQRTVEEATGDERIESLSAEVSRLQKSGYDKVVITLDNGQVWHQVDTSSLRLKVGDDIRIERAAFGSYLLQKTGSKRTMRVARKD